jgi:phosphatidylglycerophosphate synthase
MQHPLDATRQTARTGIRHIAAFLDRLSGGRITPNMVTTVGVLMHIPACYLLATGHHIWAALLLIVFGLFDVLDGELARLQKTANPFGMMYDASTDRVKEVMIYAAIAYWFSTHNQSVWAAVAVLAVGLATTVSYAKAKGEVALVVKQPTKDHHRLNRHFSEGLVAYDWRIALIIAGVLFNQLQITTAYVAVASVIMCVIVVRKVRDDLAAKQIEY